MKALCAAAAALVTLAEPASAASAESRIRVIRYDPKQVIHLEGCIGYQTMIEFGPDERIENVGVGDATQWLVVANARANLLFVRPAAPTTRSNMTVATARRRYVFDLSAAPTPDCTQGRMIYYLRFAYDDLPRPRPTPAKKTAPTQRNTAYSFRGAKENLPLSVFDDGASTYFRWPAGAPAPAVFARNDKNETLSNFSSRGDYLVANQVAPCFVLRNGSAVTTLYNDGYGARVSTAAVGDGAGVPRHRGSAKC